MKISRWIQVGFALMLAAGAAQATIVYQDDFTGRAGDAINTTPEVTVAGWGLENSNNTDIDGAGKLEAASSAANYRFRIATDPLTADPANEIISWSANLRMPSGGNQWIAIGFHENDSANLLSAGINSGPFLRFDRTQTFVSPGNKTVNAVTLGATHAAGAIVSVKMDFDVQAQTVTTWMNNAVIDSNRAINHEYPVDTPSDPVVSFAQIQFFNQPRAADGGGYVDDLKIEVIPEPATFGLLAVASSALLLIRRRFLI